MHGRSLLPKLRDRLMVGHRPLEASILVRVQVPQLRPETINLAG